MTEGPISPGLPAIVAIEAQLKQAQLMLMQSLQLVTQLKAGQTTPVMDAKTALRVQKFGAVAYAHLEFMQNNGGMTLAQSYSVRALFYGPAEIRSTANLFGKPGSGALFYREPFGLKNSPDDQVMLTKEGWRIAQLWEVQATSEQIASVSAVLKPLETA